MDAIEFISIGAQPDDGTGDSARDGGAKINRNAQKFKSAIDNLSGLKLVAGPVTKLAPGANPTASLTGTAPSYTLSLGLPEGAAGAGAPNSADILAIAERDDLLRGLAAAGVPDAPCLIADFVRGVHFASKTAVAASIMTLIAALGGVSAFLRASTATYFDSDGLMKTAAVNVPRIDYDPITRLPRGFLREPARTNLAVRSEDIDNSAWGKTRSTIVPNAAIAPDGLSTADKLVEDTTAASTHDAAIDATTVASTEHWLSIFVKAAERSRCLVQSLNFAGQDERTAVAIDLITGAFTATGVNPKADVRNCGNGWWRVSIRALRNATSTYSRLGISLADAAGNTIYTGDGTSGIYVWGGQIEEGSAPSSYIPTAASTVTRALDTLRLVTSPWVNLAEGALFVEFEAVTPPSSSNDLSVNFGTSTISDFFRLYRTQTGNGYLRSVSGGVTQISATTGMEWPATPAARCAIGWKAGDSAWAWEGALAGTSSTALNPNSLSDLYLSQSGIFNSGVIRRVMVFPRRLSNTKLQALSNQAAWS